MDPDDKHLASQDLSRLPQILISPPQHPEPHPDHKRHQGEEEEDEDEEDGNIHDTLTSLAGARLLDRYHRSILIAQAADSRRSSICSQLPPPLLQPDEEIEEADIFVPPDGGYGWFVVLGAFLALAWTSGVIKSFGVIFVSILKQFPEATAAVVSWIPAGMTTLALAMAPIASALCQKFNCRNVTLIGGILCATGIILSGFTTSVEQLFVTFGVLTGIGIGLSTTPGIILVARYFKDRRGRANAFCLSGTAAGSFFMPFFIEFLLAEYGFRGTLLILGACTLHILISGALYRPLDVHILITKNDRLRCERSKTVISSLDEEQNELLEKIPSITVEDTSRDSDSNQKSGLPHHKAANAFEYPGLRSLSFNYDTYKNSGIVGSSLAPEHVEYVQPKRSRKSSFMFSIEDLMTDSTSILKDSRFPTVAVIPAPEAEAKGEQQAVPEAHLVTMSGRRSSVMPKTAGPEATGRQRKVTLCQSQMYLKIDGGLSDQVEPFHKKKRSSSIYSVKSPFDAALISRKRTISEGHSSEFGVVIRVPSIVSQMGSMEAQANSLMPMQQPGVSKDEEAAVGGPSSTVQEKLELTQKPPSCWDKLNRYLSLSLCREPLFMIVVSSVMAMSVGVPHVLFFLPSYAGSLDLGLDAATMLAVLSVFDLVGRLGCGFGLDLNLVPIYSVYTVMVFLSGVSVLSLAIVNDFYMMFVVLSVYGVSVGGWFLMVPLLLSDFFGVEKIGSSYGLVRLFQSVSNLSGPLIAGIINDRTGSFRGTFYFMGSVMCAGSVAVLFTPLALRTKAKATSTNSTDKK